jgi:hypothetical protein
MHRAETLLIHQTADLPSGQDGPQLAPGTRKSKPYECWLRAAQVIL